MPWYIFHLQQMLQLLRGNRTVGNGHYHIPPGLLRFSLGLLWTAYLPVMTTARIASLVMDLSSVALYHMYDTDSFLGSVY